MKPGLKCRQILHCQSGISSNELHHYKGDDAGESKG